MNGMHQEANQLFTDSDSFNATFQFELAPTPTCAQISLSTYVELSDMARVDLGFISCTFLNKNNLTQIDKFPDARAEGAITAFARNGLSSVSYQMNIADCIATCLVNFFFWSAVS
jgi:hypothetical protein